VSFCQQIIAKLEEHAEEHDEEAVKARVVAKDARPFTDVLKAALRRHNVRRSKMFGGKFCGDAASRLFANAEDVAKVLQPQTFGDEPTADSKEEQKGSTIGGRWHVVMGCALGAMSCITGLIMRPAPLCEHELNSLQELVTVFANHWRVHYPDDATTPLLHNLVIDVPRFARLHGTVAQQRQRQRLMITLCADRNDERAKHGTAAPHLQALRAAVRDHGQYQKATEHDDETCVHGRSPVHTGLCTT